MCAIKLHYCCLQQQYNSPVISTYVTIELCQPDTQGFHLCYLCETRYNEDPDTHWSCSTQISRSSPQRVSRGNGGKDAEYQVSIVVVGPMHAVVQSEIHKQVCLDTFIKQVLGITKYGTYLKFKLWYKVHLFFKV